MLSYEEERSQSDGMGDTSGNGLGGHPGFFEGDGKGQGAGDGFYLDLASLVGGSGTGHGSGDGNGSGSMYGVGSSNDTNDDYSDVASAFPAEMRPLFYPLTPERILHAYAYLNATSQEEKDSILGLMELKHEK